jgi:hypothetical protein
MSVTARFTVDIDPGKRTSTNDAADNQLIFADHSVQVTFEEAGVAWAPPTGSTWELVIVDREDPTGGVLARSTAVAPAPDSVQNVLTFSLPTNTVELRAALGDARGKQEILELVRTDLTVEQTVARWMITCWNQGWDVASAVYAELKHKSTCTPDREPTADDDSLLGYAIGSIWVYCTGNSVWLCTDATPGAAVWKKLFDNLLPAAHLGTSVPSENAYIPVDDPSLLHIGDGIEVTQAGVARYYEILAVGVAEIRVAGPSLLLGTQVDLIRIMEPVTLLHFEVCRTAWDNAVGTTLLQSIEKTGFRWEGKRGHIVHLRAAQNEVNATSQGELFIRANGSRVNTAGLVLGAANEWVQINDGEIDPATYTIDRNQPIELECSAAGVPGTGRFLTVEAVVVTER